ncbi:hypothetical protein HK104_010554 [Borealophlyctis nickersoniae]|nr:hypothetical protein HK104_010554 [Borealophlyctis nickersoniae]
MFLSAQTVGRVVEKEYAGQSLTVTLQDGPFAGQTVAHVHVHIIPRKQGDWANNDEIYPEIDAKEKELANDLADAQQQQQQQKPKPLVPDNEERKPRSQEHMAAEANKLRGMFEQFEDIWS